MMMTVEMNKTIAVGDCFPSGNKITKFIKSYVGQSGKACSVSKSSGTSKTFICKTEQCSWKVCASFPKDKGDGSTREWKLTSVNDTHSDFCVKASVKSVDRLLNMNSFVSSVLASETIKMKEVLITVNGANEDGSKPEVMASKATMYRASHAVKKNYEGDIAIQYASMKGWFVELQKINKPEDVMVVLDADSHGRFLRCFLGSPSLCKNDALLGVNSCDAGHFTHKEYNGVLLAITSVDINHELIIVALAIVPKENMEHIYWFWKLCALCGVDLSLPMFMDRGTSNLAAIDQFEIRDGLLVNAKYRTLHIIRSSVYKFPRLGGINHKQFRDMVWTLQSSENFAIYEVNLLNIGLVHGNDVMEYLEKIEPHLWVVGANMLSCLGFTPWYTKRGYSDKSSLSLLLKHNKLYGWRTSNMSECENNVMRANGMRSMMPFDAMRKAASMFCESIMKRKMKGHVFQEKNFTMTPWAKDHFTEQDNQKVNYNVSPMDIDEEKGEFTFYVGRNLTQSSRSVSLSKVNVLTCSCELFDQYSFPCRHLMKSITYCKDQRNKKGASLYIEYPYCRVDVLYNQVSVYIEGFFNVHFKVPDTSCVFPSPHSLCRPPIYTQAGRPVRNTGRRIKSNGETGTGKFRTALSSKKYKCSVCKEEGHNARRCRNNNNY